MIKILRESISDIREGKNIDAYIAISLSIVIALLGLFSIVNNQIVNTVILICLGWLMSNTLNSHKENAKKLDVALQNITQGRTVLSAKLFFSENYVNNSQSFQDAINTANELYIAGYAQNRMIVSYAPQISRICSSGGTFKLIVMDPSSSLIELANKRSATPSKVSDVQHQHQAALAKLGSIKEQHFTKGIFEVRLIDFIIPYTIIGFDFANPEKAKIYIWLTPFKEPSRTRPGFVVTEKDDPEWYHFFKGQFEKMWDWKETKPHRFYNT
jgi:hypothetical protein